MLLNEVLEDERMSEWHREVFRVWREGRGGAGYFTEGNYNDFRSLNLRVLLCVHISFVSFEVYCLLSFVFT